MTDYQKYINALRKCANEHENDRTSTGHVIVSDLCRDTANLLEELSSLEKSNKSEIPASSTTKNDLPHCQHTDSEIAKSFIEDVEAVKDQLPCGEQMDFPDTFDEFAKDYGFRDKDEIYTNGSELIPVFRVKQWLEHILTTKNDLEVDCIDRQATLDAIIKRLGIKNETYLLEAERVIYQQILAMPSVTPQDPKWIPVNERFPNSDNEVLCWYEYYHWSQEKVLPEYGLGRYFKKTKAWFGEVASGKDVRVIAWMPLPKPYSEVEE